MNEKVYTPEVIQDTPFPGEPLIGSTQSPTSSSNVLTPTTTKDNQFKRKKIAIELLSTALNTRSKKILQEFELQQSGGLKIGNFEEGITGDLRITPNGLTARDLAGLITFAIDGTTGDAIFKGTVQAGAIIAGALVSGSVDVDDAGTLRLFAGGDIQLFSEIGDQSEILFWDNNNKEFDAKIYADQTTGFLYITPNTNDSSALSLGDSTRNFTSISGYAIDEILLQTKGNSGNRYKISILENKIEFYYNDVIKARLDSSGNLFIAGTISQNYVF